MQAARSACERRPGAAAAPSAGAARDERKAGSSLSRLGGNELHDVGHDLIPVRLVEKLVEGTVVNLQPWVHTTLPSEVAPRAVQAVAAAGRIELVPAAVEDQRRSPLEDVRVIGQEVRHLGLLVHDVRKHPCSVALAPAEHVSAHAIHRVRVSRQDVRLNWLRDNHLWEPPGHVLQLLVWRLFPHRRESHGRPCALRGRLPRALRRVQAARDVALVIDEACELEGRRYEYYRGSHSPRVCEVAQLYERTHHNEGPQALADENKARSG
mmetsp:Transcript_4477/g.12320  ORF Transcript_4477/g.12320 Transcript_4477/m.12320 type:complete len:267 (-) Transcript_4477:505-1305(-)